MIFEDIFKSADLKVIKRQGLALCFSCGTTVGRDIIVQHQLDCIKKASYAATSRVQTAASRVSSKPRSHTPIIDTRLVAKLESFKFTSRPDFDKALDDNRNTKEESDYDYEDDYHTEEQEDYTPQIPSERVETSREVKKATMPADDQEFVPVLDRIPCPHCDRKFAAEAFERHESKCAKLANKKRPAFNSLKMRIGGTEAEKFVSKQVKEEFEQKVLKKAPIVTKREEVKREPSPPPVRSLRQAMNTRMQQQDQPKEIILKRNRLPKLPQKKHSITETVVDLHQCTSCLRSFNESALERHAPICRKTKAQDHYRAIDKANRSSKTSDHLKKRNNYHAYT